MNNSHKKPHQEHNDNWLFEEHEWQALAGKKTDKQELEEYKKRIAGFLKYQSYKTKYRVSKRLKLQKLLLKIDINKLKTLLNAVYLKAHSNKKYTFGIFGLILLFVFTIPTGLKTSEQVIQEEETSSGNSLVLSESVEKVDPSFEVVIPEETKTVEKDEVLFDPEKQVASYQDTVGGVKVTVSQFPVPEGFENNPQEELKKIADSISATTVISDSDPRAYLGSSHKGPQIVVFYKDGLLIFIQSSAEVKLLAWNEYIKTLY